MTQPSRPLPLGSHTLAAALLVGGVQAHAQETPPLAPQSLQTATNAAETPCIESAKCPTDSIERIKVHGIQYSHYRFDKASDIRRTQSLFETPQMISVISQDQIQEAGNSDLKEVLISQAGITLGTGENGNAFGDRYIIRGHEARSDVFVDGLRDSGMSTRESFATERVEITKGPSGTFAGRGSSGGAVNSVTKVAATDYQIGRLDLGIGSDDYHRAVIDVNQPLNAWSAVRINALHADEQAPDRTGITRARQGAHASVLFTPNSRWNVIADGYYLNAEDVPDLGSYFDQNTQQPLAEVPVYAQQGDFLRSDVRTATLRSQYQWHEDLILSQATRVGRTENGYVLTGLRGTTRDISDPTAPEQSTLSLSSHQGWQEVAYWSTQWNLAGQHRLGGWQHHWVVGGEFTEESVDNGQYELAYGNPSNCIVAGRRGASAGYCILDGNGSPLSDINTLMGRTALVGAPDAQFRVKTASAYLLDNIELSPRWQLHVGVRADKYRYRNAVTRNDETTEYLYGDTLVNGHAGLLFRVTDNGNLYFNYGTANNINGGESDLGASCGYGGICGDSTQAAQAKPETVENLELGTKWRLGSDLLLSAALFQITKSDVMESVGEDDYALLGSLNTGKNRVQGVELELMGQLTDRLSMQLSATAMAAEVLESIDPDTLGLTLSNFAERSLYAQLRYQASPRFAFGGDYSYQGKMYAGQPDGGAGFDADNDRYSITVPSYEVFDLFAQYQHSPHLQLQLNVANLLDETYYLAAYRSGAFMYLGDARHVRFSLNYQF
ncbi:MAG: TonB-dependent receptor [Ferrimonas sp.]